MNAVTTTLDLCMPVARRLPLAGAEAYVVDDFLTPGECARICRTVHGHLSPSMTTSGPDGRNFRRSQTAFLGYIESNLVADVDRRIGDLLGLQRGPAEPLQAHVYDVSDEFIPHTDYFKPGELRRYKRDPGQRAVTVLIYLQEPECGGETVFTEFGLSIRPKRGCALVWMNLNLDGEPNPLTRHASNPVIRGQKIVLTKWFNQRRRVLTPERDAGESLAPVTREGFLKRTIPRSLWLPLRDWYRENSETAKIESVATRYLKQSTGGERRPSDILELPTEFRARIQRELKPLIEEWCGTAVSPTWTYGARIYQRGARLLPHRDRLETHVLGASLNIDQSDKNYWPIRIQDHLYRWRSMSIQPGQMIFFESARLLHERPVPLRSDRYIGVFSHFLPVSPIQKWHHG